MTADPWRNHGGYEMDEVEDPYPSYAASAVHVSPITGYHQVTTKIPPSYDGRMSWFAYEEAVDDWCDITELPADKRGPALRNRLDGEAAIYKTLLDREELRDPDNGVTYFKATLRPYFVKGSQSVFMWFLPALQVVPRIIGLVEMVGTHQRLAKATAGGMDGPP